jgi:hypothetical protein
VECEAISRKPIWIVKWHVSYDPYQYYVRFEEWMGVEGNRIVRLTKTEPKTGWRCETYEDVEKGIEELIMILTTDKPRVVFATGRLPEKLKDTLRRLSPSTYYLAVM